MDTVSALSQENASGDAHLIHEATTRNLTRLVAELDQLERRQSSLLQVLDAHATGSLGTGPGTPLDAVRTTMRKLPHYQQKSVGMHKHMDEVHARVRKLQQRVLKLRTAVPSTKAYHERGRFAYRVVYKGGIGVRLHPDVSSPTTGEILQFGQVFWAIERYAPVGSEIMFVRLALTSQLGPGGGGNGDDNGDGWVFETKGSTGILERVNGQRITSEVFSPNPSPSLAPSHAPSGPGGGAPPLSV